MLFEEPEGWLEVSGLGEPAAGGGYMGVAAAELGPVGAADPVQQPAGVLDPGVGAHQVEDGAGVLDQVAGQPDGGGKGVGDDGQVRQMRIDQVVEETYIATVEVEGPPGVQSVDARPSDALNLTALVQAPIFVTTEVLQEADARRAGDSPEAARLRRALVVPPMTIEQARM